MRKSRGFTLVEMVVVLFILAICIAMAAVITRAITAGQKSALTTTRMSNVDAALVQFVQQQKRLPCPADGTLASTDNNAGLEVRNAGACNGNLANGVAPWRTLALSESDTTDGWDRRLTYRIDVSLGLDSGMDMSQCDSAGTEGAPLFAAKPACAPSCSTATALTSASCTPPIPFLKGKGVTVKNLAGVTVMDPNAAGAPTGAAYVLISHGESGGGAFLGSGSRAATTGNDSPEEAKNYADPVAAYYVDDSYNNVAGAAHFDDVVSRPSILSVVTKAGLGPRSHP